MSDHNKCPSSEKEHEKCIFRLSYFHRIQPNNIVRHWHWFCILLSYFNNHVNLHTGRWEMAQKVRKLRDGKLALPIFYLCDKSLVKRYFLCPWYVASFGSSGQFTPEGTKAENGKTSRRNASTYTGQKKWETNSMHKGRLSTFLQIASHTYYWQNQVVDWL